MVVVAWAREGLLFRKKSDFIIKEIRAKQTIVVPVNSALMSGLFGYDFFLLIIKY